MIHKFGNTTINSRDMKETCELRKSCGLPCIRCIYEEHCDGEGNVKKDSKFARKDKKNGD